MDTIEDYWAHVETFGLDGAQERFNEYDASCAPGRAAAEQLADIEPGPALLVEIRKVQAMILDRGGQVLVYSAFERYKSWIDAESMVPLRAAVGRPSNDLAKVIIPDLAGQTHLSENTIGTRVAQMWHLEQGLPWTYESERAGRLTTTHTWVMCNETRHASLEIAREVEALVIPKAIENGWTPAQLGNAARTALLTLDPEGAEQRAEDAKKQADVRFRSEPDEMATVSAYGDVWTQRQIMDEIDRLAEEMQRAGDDRNVGERRMGALSKAVLGEDTTQDSSDAPNDAVPTDDVTPKAGRRPKRATALLLVSLPTLLGGSGPARLEGCGPITAKLARRIAASDIDFRRLVFDPLTGLPVEVGDRYEVREPVRRWIEVRDRVCVFPGCMCRAVVCDVDHAIEFPEGQTTCENCGLLCRKHHNLKTKKWWKRKQNPDNSVDWVSPLGFRYHVPARDYSEFVDQPDPPPDCWALDECVGDDPDPPDVLLFPLSTQPPPPHDEDDEEYDAAVTSGEWRQISAGLAQTLIADATAH